MPNYFQPPTQNPYYNPGAARPVSPMRPIRQSPMAGSPSAWLVNHTNYTTGEPGDPNFDPNAPALTMPAAAPAGTPPPPPPSAPPPPPGWPAGVKWPPTHSVRTGSDIYGDPIYTEEVDGQAIADIMRAFGLGGFGPTATSGDTAATIQAANSRAQAQLQSDNARATQQHADEVARLAQELKIAQDRLANDQTMTENQRRQAEADLQQRYAQMTQLQQQFQATLASNQDQYNRTLEANKQNEAANRALTTRGQDLQNSQFFSANPFAIYMNRRAGIGNLPQGATRFGSNAPTDVGLPPPGPRAFDPNFGITSKFTDQNGNFRIISRQELATWTPSERSIYLAEAGLRGLSPDDINSQVDQSTPQAGGLPTRRPGRGF